MSMTRQTVLIVDDEPMNIELLSGILGEEVDILFAVSAQEALLIAGREQPDLVLLDVMMPGMDGYAICAALKAAPETRDIPVIFVTALADEHDEARGLEAGAIDYLTKPVSPPIVRARVRNHLELKRYRDVLRRLSAVDGLTGIANRRRFDDALENEWRRGQRNAAPLSLLLGDLDFFKAYNDRYGHLAGDECLRRTARTISSQVRRPADLVARWGGEEFAVLLPDTTHDGALLVAEHIRAAVQGMGIPHSGSQIADVVTISLGVGTLIPDPDFPPSDLVQLADNGLYNAKRGGRNRCLGPLTD